MIIKQDPITGLWCRNDGAILMPPCPNIHRFTYTWTFGSSESYGYKTIKFHGKQHKVHRIVCCAFNGSAPKGKPEVDHINRIKGDNRPENLRWADHKENQGNRDYVDRAIEKFGVRQCDDRAAYNRAYYETHCEEIKARERARYKSQREEIKAYNKAYYETHCEELKARSRARYKAYRDAFKDCEEEYAKALIKFQSFTSGSAT